MSVPDEVVIAQLREALDELCRRDVSPTYVRECDRAKRFPVEAMHALAAAGYSSMPVPEAFGGTGASAVELTVAHVTLARHSLAVAQAFYSLWVLGAQAIATLGSDAQRSRWLPRIAKGDAYVAFALTEPASGSDAAALKSTATRRGGEWVVNGQKVFISGAAVSDVIITAVRTGTGSSRHEGLSLLLIDPRAHGVTIRKLEKIGLHPLDLCEVFFDEVIVPREDLLGPENDGWRSMRAGLASERALLAAICAGALQDLVAVCADYAQKRVTFGEAIGHHQMVAQRIVDMRVNAVAAEVLAFEAARTIDRGRAAAVNASIAKLFASEAYVSGTRSAVQVFGGYGYIEDSVVARHYRDAKYLEIGGGTSEIQRLIIGRDMGLM